jgi:UDP-GlcNAc:undecaprenyl-phosphate/decaprenyl-phosphate GlcNAc-1-phosphate transferase
MYAMFFLGIVSFALSLVLTPLFRNLALRLHLVDEPDHHRKIHKVPIPRMGGVAIIASAIGAYALLFVLKLNAGAIIWSGAPFALRLLPAVTVIFGVGLIDDIFQVQPLYKLLGQCGAAVLAWESGIHLSSIGGHDLPATVSFVLTTLWIVACSNAINLIDGVDGLATGVGLFAVVTTLIAAMFHHNVDLAFATIPLAGALLGFLRYNFSPASIFLGDCGSLTLGFLLGCYGVVWSEKSTTILSMIAPLMVLFVPLLDVSLAVVRRFLGGRPIFAADRGHIHHKLLSQGLAPWRVVVIIYGFCGLTSIAGLLLSATQNQYRSVIVIVVVLAALLGIQHLGYTEFGIAGKTLFGGGFYRLFDAQLSLAKFEQELAASITLEDTWALLCRESSSFGFSGIELSIDGETRLKRTNSCWHIRVDFPNRGHIILARESGAKGGASAGVLFVDCVERVLVKKLNELTPSSSELPAYAQAN